MKVAHPAWRFILALKANRRDPQHFGLPACGGCELWNQTTERLSEIIRLADSDNDSQLDDLFRDPAHGEDYSFLYDSFRIFNLSSYRVALETFALAGISDSEIASILGLDAKTLGIYILAFFDVSVFKTNIDRHEYVAGIRDGVERSLKEEWTKDTNYLKWRLGFRNETDTKAILTALLSEVYYRFRASDNNKAAMKLCDLAVKTANKLIDSVDSDKFMEDMHLALKLKAPDIKPLKK